MNNPPFHDRVLTAELVQHLTLLSGLDLSLERAADLLPQLAPMLAGDAEIAALDLGTLSPLGPTWPETARE
ncbi:hypothetical protein [Deinococcus rubellus]|uniref:hypothetical protein n=1 Tax=Deinococcus rubellus TaxID=1889240 RepID=UPI0031F12358